MFVVLLFLWTVSVGVRSFTVDKASPFTLQVPKRKNSEMEEVTKQISVMELKLDGVLDMVETLKNKTEGRTSTVSITGQESQDLKEALRDLTIKYNQIKKQHDGYQKTGEANFTDLSTKYDHILNEVGVLAKRIDGKMTPQVKEVLDIVETLKASTATQTEAIARTGQENQELKKALGDLRSKYEQTQNQVDDEQKTREANFKVLSTKYNSILNEVGKLHTEINDAVKPQLKRAMDTVETLTAETKQQAETVAKTAQENQDLKGDIEDMKLKYDLIQKEIEENKKTREANFNELSTNYGNLVKEVSEVAKELKDSKRCGLLPQIPNSDVIYEGNLIDQTAEYSCHPNFRMCGDKSNITCQSTGHWEPPSKCGQYKWENPDVPFEKPLPCGKQSKLELVIKGKPTLKRVFFIQIKRGRDVVFHVEVRSYYKGYTRRVVFNVCIYGKQQWLGRNEVFAKSFPFDHLKTFKVNITLKNGVYEFAVDDELLTSYPEKEKGAMPDNIVISEDVALDLVEVVV